MAKQYCSEITHRQQIMFTDIITTYLSAAAAAAARRRALKAATHTSELVGN